MSVWITLFLSVLGTVAFFGAFYGLVTAILGRKQFKGKPKLGMTGGEKSTLGVWVQWSTEAYNLQVYRLRFQLMQPYGNLKESTFTVTLEPPQKAPFLQWVKLPPEFSQALDGSDSRALFQVEFRTVEEMSEARVKKIAKVRSVYRTKGGKVPQNLTVLDAVGPDVPSVMSLDFSELQIRRKKLKDLEAAAKAKAAKAPPKPTAPAVAVPAPAAPVPPASPPPQETVSEAVPSIRSVIAREKGAT